MQSSVLVTLLIVCAVLLVVGGLLLLLAVVALALLMRTEEPTRSGTPVYASVPVPAGPPPSPNPEDDFAGLDDEEVAKTEVFMRRGSMNLDWDGEDSEDATELVRADMIEDFQES